MDIKKHYQHIAAYLGQTRAVWAHEVLERDPSLWPKEYQELLQEVSQLSHYEKWKILEQRSPHPLTSVSRRLQHHLELCEKLTKLPSIQSQRTLKLPSWAFKKVRHKKQHEISVLAQVLDEIRQQIGPSQLIDIGGGQGHFARVMSHYFNWETTSIDREQKFIELGLKRLKKYPPPKNAAKLDLKRLDFQGLESPDQIGVENLFQKNSFSLGLHTCGSLAVRHLQTHQNFQTKGLLNFGCCYGKIQKEEDLNLSKTALESPVQWSTPALNLAARAHAQLSYPDFCMQERVKSYRYALGLFLESRFPGEDVSSVGNAPGRNYLGPFTSYARVKFDYLNRAWGLELEKELEEFYYSHETRQKLEQLFCADIIRWSFGRLLELAILLDRALYVSEDGKQKVQLVQFFEESISPRNIGLLAYREELAD